MNILRDGSLNRREIKINLSHNNVYFNESSIMKARFVSKRGRTTAAVDAGRCGSIFQMTGFFWRLKGGFGAYSALLAILRLILGALVSALPHVQHLLRVKRLFIRTRELPGSFHQGMRMCAAFLVLCSNMPIPSRGLP